MDSGLASNSRIQRLLWTQDYVTLTEEVILLESSFVLNRRDDLQMRMVQVGLTSSALLIAEDKLPSMSPANKNLQRRTDECDADLELFELIYLFPLGNVRLSIRTHSEMIGEHVIRVSLCNGLKWYLEISDLRHREDKWHEWVWWINELEQRRRRESKARRNKHRLHFNRDRTPGKGEHGTSQFDTKSRTITTMDQNFPKTSEAAGNQREAKVESSIPYRIVSLRRGRKQSTAHRWVHHFAEHIIDHHDEALPDNDDEDEPHGTSHPDEDTKKHGQNSEANSNNPIIFDDRLSHDKLRSRRSSNMWSDSHLNLNRSSLGSGRGGSKGLLMNRMQSIIRQNSGADSLSSLEDIASIGSFVSSNAESWTNRHARDTRKGLLLSVDDLFEKTNFEAHAHGHVGRTRPMASMTRLDLLLENLSNCQQDKTRRGFANRGEIHHTSSLPDVLDGEASFIEDLPNADEVTHRASLVYLDLENDDSDRTPHVINGHVMLLTKEEMDLHKLVEALRKTKPDTRLRGTKNANPTESHKNVPKKQKRRFSIARHSVRPEPSYDPAESTKRQITRPTGKRMSIFFTGANRRLSILRESPFEAHIFNTMRDVHPDELVDEITSIDVELFLRIHEAELVGCMWLKEERKYRAPNVISAIGFFKKVAGMVTKEVLLPDRTDERALAIVHFLKAADGLREKQNYHSSRAILAGLQSPAVYRLRDTWTVLEEQHPTEYQLWQDLLDHTDNESLSLDNDHGLDQAMRAPPCLPFLGSVLMRIIEFYSTTDVNGTRIAHQLYDDHKGAVSSNGSEFECAIDIVEGHDLVDDVRKGDDASIRNDEVKSSFPKHEPKIFSIFKKLTQRVNALGSKHSIGMEDDKTGRKGMTACRKQHIRMLILEYARLVAEERGRERFGTLGPMRGILGREFWEVWDSRIWLLRCPKVPNLPTEVWYRLSKTSCEVLDKFHFETILARMES